MSAMTRELYFFLRLRSGIAALALLLLLGLGGVASGLLETQRQHDAITRMQPLQASDVSAISAWVSRSGDPGNAAYYTFHATWNPPSDLAFAALGMGDVAPSILRVRALGLEAQLYEGDIVNPEVAMPGRFDFAFVLIYVAPLFVILLLHDLFSAEREAGRLGVLRSTPQATARLWAPRIAVRLAGLLVALALPFLLGAFIAGTPGWKTASVLGLIAAYLAFWALLSLAVARLGTTSIGNGMTLAALWLVLALVAPSLAHVAINTAVPLRQGAELSLLQRNAVHGAWDKPKAATMDAFFQSHPEWAGTAPVTAPFHWKWYFAFHQVGDESVATLAQQYRDGILERSRLAERLGLILPTVGVQLALHRLAETDPRAQLAYQDRIRAFHKRLRTFYYPYIFNELPFGMEDFEKAPRYAPEAKQP
jgi:ABC-2 type transport system permease protein